MENAYDHVVSLIGASMKFYALASGSKGNCYIVNHQDQWIMIDCASSSKRYLIEALDLIGLAISNIDAILVTHGHSDHISQLKLVKDRPIYSACHLKEEFNQIMIKPLKTFTIGHFQIMPIALSHDSPNTVGFIITCKEETLVFITDTGYLRNEYLGLIENADYYIIESNHDTEMLWQSKRPIYLKQRITSDVGHLCNEDCANILYTVVGEKTKSVWLAHLSEETNTLDKALACSQKRLQGLNFHIAIKALKQFEVVSGGQE